MTKSVVLEATIAALTASHSCQINQFETKIESIVTVKHDSLVLPVELIIQVSNQHLRYFSNFVPNVPHFVHFDYCHYLITLLQ